MVLNKNILSATVIVIFFSLIISLTFWASIAWAQSGPTPGAPSGPSPSGGGSFTITNPAQSTTFAQVVQGIATLLQAIGIPLLTIFLIWAGFLFVTARGNEQQLAKAKTIFFWTIVGAIFILGAVVFANVFVNFAAGI